MNRRKFLKALSVITGAVVTVPALLVKKDEEVSPTHNPYNSDVWKEKLTEHKLDMELQALFPYQDEINKAHSVVLQGIRNGL